MTTKHIHFDENGLKFCEAYRFVENYINETDEAIRSDIDGKALSNILAWANYDLQAFLPYLAQKKQYKTLLELCVEKFNWHTRMNDGTLELIKESLTACPRLYERFLHDAGPRSYRDGMHEMLEQMYPHCAPHVSDGRFDYIPEMYKADKPVVLSLITRFPNFIKGVVDCDNDFLKQCVAKNAKVLEFKTSKVRGKIVLMRELARINPECAKYALSPITTNAGVKKDDNDQERYEKVLNWLTATDVRKTLKTAGVLVASKQAAAAPKKVHKI